MRYRQFGKTGWRVSEIGFGGARIGGLLAQDGGRANSLRTLEAAYDAGINFYDTADMYAQGESERLIGRAFRGKRDKVFIASKGGYRLPARRKLVQIIKPFAKPVARALGLRRNPVQSALSGSLSQDFSPSYLVTAAESSLRRLKSDYIDLYQLHSPPREELRRARFQDALGVLARLKQQGKIRQFGIALDSATDGRLCLGMAGIASLQFPFGLLDLEALDGILEEVSNSQFAIIARGCFGGGALKASVTEADLRATEPKWERVLRIRHIAEQLGRTPLEAAVQFSLRFDRISVNIIGMRTSEHLATNLEYYSATALSDEEFQELLKNASALEV